MRTLLLSAILLFASVQIATASDKSISERIQEPVIVVLNSSNEAFSNSVKYAVQNYWTATTFQFITDAEFETMKNNSDNVFLVISENQSAESAGTVYDQVFKLVYFIKGGKLMNQVTGTPVIQKQGEETKSSVINAVRILQDKLQFTLFQEEKNAGFVSYDKNVSSRSSIIKAKKLVIAKEDLDSDLTLENIKKVYTGEVVVVNREELNNMIDSKTADIIYAVLYNKKTSSISYINTKQIVDAVSGEVVYYEETTTIKPEGFTKKDIKNFAD